MGTRQVRSVADADSRLVAATVERLRRENAPVYSETGPAEVTVDRIIPKLNKSGLHFAFLDPYNLGALPFKVIKKLAQLQRMDILVHVSVQDLNRNLLRYASRHRRPRLTLSRRVGASMLMLTVLLRTCAASYSSTGVCCCRQSECQLQRRQSL